MRRTQTPLGFLRIPFAHLRTHVLQRPVTLGALFLKLTKMFLTQLVQTAALESKLGSGDRFSID